MNVPVSVLLADEDPNVRRCLRKAMDSVNRLCVQWEADNGLQALALIQQHRPDLVLIDSRMQRMTGLEATRCVRHCNKEVKIVIMSVFETDREQAMEAGADAFVVKGSGCEAFRSAVNAILGTDTL